MVTECDKITIWKITKQFCKNNKKHVGLFGLSLLNMPVKEILVPILLGILYNKVKERKKNEIIIYCIVLGCTVIVTNVLDVFEKYCESILFPALQVEIRNVVIKHIFKNASENFKEQESGVVLAHIIRFPYTLYGFLHNFMKSYIPGIVKGIFFIIYFFVLKWQLGVLSSIIIIIYILACAKAIYNCSKISVCRDSHINNIYKNIEDSLTNIKSVLTYNNTESELLRINSSQAAYTETSVKTNMCSIKPRVFIIIALFALSALVVVGYLKVVPIWNLHTLSTGSIIAVLVIIYSTYMIALIQTNDLKDTIFAYGPIQNTLSVLNNCDKMKDIHSMIKNQTTTDISRKGIVLHHVHFKYSENGKIILDDISLHIKQKGITLILGEIGSGKSTIINLIMKYYSPNNGDMYLDGVHYNDISTTSVRERVSYISQAPVFFNRSMYENIVYGMEDRMTEGIVLEKINELDLNSFMNSFPDGLDTNVGVRGSSLSGGQKQVISLIKMALLEPEYVLLDEPTSAMDGQTIKWAKNVIRKLSEKSSVIIVTHDNNIRDLADETYIISEGKAHKQNEL